MFQCTPSSPKRDMSQPLTSRVARVPRAPRVLKARGASHVELLLTMAVVVLALASALRVLSGGYKQALTSMTGALLALVQTGANPTPTPLEARWAPPDPPPESLSHSRGTHPIIDGPATPADPTPART